MRQLLLEGQRTHPEPSQPGDLYTAQLEQIQQYLHDGALPQARKKLRALDQDATAGAMGRDTRARYLRLRGVLEEREGDSRAAAQRYVEAFAFDDRSAPAMAFRGHAALVQGDPALALECLDRAIQLDPTRMDARANRLFALEQLGRTDELERVRAHLGVHDLDLALALCHLELNAKRFDQAQATLEVLADGPYQRHGRLLAARALTVLLRVQTEVGQKVLLPEVIAARPDVREALGWAERAIDALEEDLTHREELLDAYRVCQVVLSWRGDTEGVLRLTAQALQIAPDDDLLRQNQLLALWNAKRFELLWQTYQGLTPKRRHMPLQLMAMNAATALGRWDGVLSVTDTLLSAVLGADERGDVLLTRTQALIELKRVDEVQRLLEGEDADRWQVSIARAELALVMQDLKQANEAFERAYGAAPTDRQVEIALRWAYTVTAEKDHKQQATVLTRILHHPLDARQLEGVVLPLYHAGRTGDVRAVVASATVAGVQPSLSVRHVRALIALQEGEVDAGVRDLEALAREVPELSAFALHLAQALLLQGRQAEAALELKRFSQLNPPEGDLLLEAAQAARSAGQDALALDLAYRAWRLNYGDEAMHTAYAMLAMKLSHESNRPVVEAECAMRLTGEDVQARWVVLTDDQEPRPERGEFALNSELATALLGTKLGETVKVREGVGGTLTVEAIVTKYARAEIHFFQEFHDLFPDSQTMLRFDVRDTFEVGVLPTVLTEVMAHSKRIADQRAEARTLFQEQGLPHIANAALASQDTVPFWEREVSGGSGFVSFTSDPLDREAAREAFRGGSAVVDASTLVSLAAADLLDKLSVCLNALKVTQHVVQELRRSAHPLARTALAFVQDHCTLVPSPGLHDTALGDWAELMPVAARSALLAASALNLPLLTEDAGFRTANRIGLFGPTVPSFGTMDLLLEGQARGTLSQAMAVEGLLELMQVGHALVPVTPALLERALQQDSGCLGPTLKAVIRAIYHPRILSEWTAGWTAALLRLVWLSSAYALTRQTIVWAIIEPLSATDDWKERLTTLGSALRAAFFMMPVSLEEVLGFVTEALRCQRQTRVQLSET